ncbi:hypothetical protein POF50_008980 [Streptomyces sp. SL13]|uniref:Uncharacterized protein n=1 Tax=Streptantibioticus silvisoli TaxID=2705255 RepID=A0AA90H1W2_9ACTN|nr:hypothetical protein [Streptantibioticus silvisoli]MDI5969473.1 hypothetical protein [Streptantibioticus silvisoli]
MTTPTPQQPYPGGRPHGTRPPEQPPQAPGAQPHTYDGQQQAYGAQQQAYEGQQSYGARPQAYGTQQTYEGRPQAQAYDGQPQGHGARPQAYDGRPPQAYGAQAYGQPLPPAGEQPVPSAGAPGPAGQGAAPVSAHRTGSPIIPPGLQPALLTVALSALTAGGALLGRPALAVAAVLLQAVTAAGWFRLNGMWPARQGIALAFLAGVVADVALLIAPADRGPGVIMGTLGVWIPLIVVQQMRHHGSPDERLSSLTATSASTLLAVLAAGLLAQGGHPVVVGAVAVAVATLVRSVRLPGPVSVAVSLLAAAAAGYGTVHLAGWPVSWTVVAAAAGLCALIGLRVASYDWPSRFVHFTAGVALPLAVAAPVVWTTAWLLAK